jgi:hypothetical protein
MWASFSDCTYKTSGNVAAPRPAQKRTCQACTSEAVVQIVLESVVGMDSGGCACAE